MTAKSERLSPHIGGSLNLLRSSYKVHYAAGEDVLPIIAKPWVALSIGGDAFKLIAANKELGIAAKRYAEPEYAALVYQGYELIKPIVKRNKFPLLLPLGVQGDTLVFPLMKVIGEEFHDHGAMNHLKELLRGISLPLDLAGFLSGMNLERGRNIYNDPFSDSAIELYEKTGVIFD